MEHFISNLLSRYEKGTLTRRQAIRGLAVLAATGGAASTAEGQDNAEIRGNSINHVSIRVSDLERSVEVLPEPIRPDHQGQERTRLPRRSASSWGAAICLSAAVTLLERWTTLRSGWTASTGIQFVRS